MTINIPKINNIFPEKAIVVNNKAEYKYSEGKLTILKENSTDEEGMIYWNSEDNYIVTLVYNTKLPTQEIEMPINLKVICPNNATIIQDSITKRYSTDKEIGQLVEAEINGPQEISKGFMYNNLNQVQNKLDTEYEIKYKIKVGYTELLDGIKLTEANADNFTINKKIEINHDELNRILGENGKITVYDEKGIEIGNLTNKQTEINVDVSNIHVETSKPILEGEINLIVTKKINNDIFKEKTQISSLEKVKNMVKISGIYNEKQVSDTVLLTEIKMLEPTSKSTIETNQNYLSTIVENKNVIININLETNSGEDALYENPEFEITLPNQVEKIQITDARIFYEDELKQDEFTINKNRINLKFKGKQSKYISSEISKGAIIRIVTNISLDTLETSDNSEIKLQYKNNATGETKSVSSKISIIAPNEIITTNTIDDVSAQTKDEVKKIDVYENEKQMTVGGEIINNLKKGIDKLVIIGRTPYSGNKNINGDNLNSTFTCNLLSKINIEGFDADVYYSSNENANQNLNDESNQWKTQWKYNCKTYMIIPKSKINDKDKIEFNYKIKIPADLVYDNSSNTSYAVYYNGENEQQQRQVLSKTVGITTGPKTSITSNITVKDTYTGVQIFEKGDVREGENLTYTFKVKNEGLEDNSNVKVNVDFADGYVKCILKDAFDNNFMKEIILQDGMFSKTEELGLLKAGEEKTFSYSFIVNGTIKNLKESQYITANKSDDILEKVKVTITADNINNVSKNEFDVKLNKGDLSVDLRSNYEDQIIENGKDVKFRIHLKNVNEEEKSNIDIKLTLPNELEYIQTDENENNISYNSKTNEIIYHTNSLKGRESKYIIINTKANQDLKNDIDVNAIATYENAENETNSNSIKLYGNNANIETKVGTNINEFDILDIDSLEYIVNIKNSGSTAATILFSDVIPKELQCLSYKIESTNDSHSKNETYYSNTIGEKITLDGHEEIKITIVTKPYSMQINNYKEVENKPNITVLTKEGEAKKEIETDSIKNKIIGTKAEKNTENQTNKIYKITGTIWVDKDKNGKKDEEEQKIENIKIKLLDGESGQPVKNDDGSDQIAYTDKDGKYVFNNLENGKYIITAVYDSKKYKITTYKKQEIKEYENNDFIEDKNIDIAITDNIIIKNTNKYNVDLGLFESKKFDFQLEQNVSKILIIDSNSNKQEKEINAKNVKLDVNEENSQGIELLITYKIIITNKGEISGYVNEIVNYLPTNISFISEINEKWYKQKDGNIYNNSLSNAEIKPGETRELELNLLTKISENKDTMIHNSIEINKTSNKYGIEDINSVPGDKEENENDIDFSNVIINKVSLKMRIFLLGAIIPGLAFIL